MKIGLINAYFGKFPNYFPLFLVSAAKNPNFDFLIFSDNKVNIDLPSNVKIIGMTFEQLANRIQSLYPFRIALNFPYKLSDFRPAYGEIFKKELSGYTHWGYFDLDIVLGDLSQTIKNEDLLMFDRVGERGHLTIFKNNPKVVQAYRLENNANGFSYREAFQNDRSFHFDEMWGINTFFENGHFTSKPLKNDLTPGAIFDASVKSYPLVQSANHKSGIFFIFEWQDGKLIGYSQKQKIESSYLHLQKRQMSILSLYNQIGRKDLSELADFFIDQNHFFIRLDAPKNNFIKDELSHQNMHWPEGNFHHLFKYYKNTVVSGEQLSRCQLVLKRHF